MDSHAAYLCGEEAILMASNRVGKTGRHNSKKELRTVNKALNIDGTPMVETPVVVENAASAAAKIDAFSEEAELSIGSKAVAEIFEFVIGEEEAGQRLDTYLGEILDDCSRSYVQKLIAEGFVTVNEKTEESKNHRLKNGERLVVGMPQPENLTVEPENIPIEIVYEDDDLIVVNKAHGMVVHPAPGNYTGTLVNAVLYHCKNLSSINGVIRPGIVHRIDKDTSGLLVIAKNNTAHQSLSEQFKEHTIHRVYTGIVQGNMKKDEGTVDAPIARNPKDRLKMSVVEGGRHAVTHFRVTERFNGYTLVECQLETGRTHQIRVHMAYVGYPLLGDPLYNGLKSKIKFDGQLLHARELGFIHPTTGKEMMFKSDLPAWFQEILDKLKHM